MLRNSKVPGNTPATLKSFASFGDNPPVFIGRRRHRRYVIRGAIGREAHVQYTGSAKQTAPTESGQDVHRSDSLLDPDSRLMEETDELLQLWVQASAPPKGNPSPQQPNSFRGTSPSVTSTLEPPAALVERLASTPASDAPEPTDNAVRPGTNLPYASIQQSATSSLGKSGLQDSPRMANWPVTNSTSYNLSIGHFTRFPAITAARSLHTDTVVKQQVETQSNLPAEANSAALLPTISEVGIRKHLRLWQELQNKDPVQASPNTGSSVAQPVENDGDSILETSEHTLHDDLETFNPTGVDKEGDTDDEVFLRSGDVVSFSTKSDILLAVFTRLIGSQAQFYDAQGNWIHKSIRKVYHTIPRMFSVEDLEPILPYLPTEEIDTDALNKLHVMDASIPRSVGAKLLEKLQSFEQASAEVFRDHLGRIDRVHSLVAHEWQRRELSLQEITSIVLQKPDIGDLTEVELYTVHKVLIKDSKFRPQAIARHRIYPIWKINPLNQIRDFDRVKQWLREHLEVVIAQATSSEHTSDSTYRDENPVSRFVKKARKLIQTSRMHRKVTTYASMGPSDQQVIPGPSNSDSVVSESPLIRFDPEERTIIEYLKDWVLSQHMPRLGSTWSLSPTLLRAIGMYEGYDLAEATGSLLLRELGVIAPWENDALYSPQLRIPCKQDPEVLQLWKNATNSVNAIVQFPERSQEHFQDSLEDLRTDWGDMTVYCIDDAGAQEIDDGVSVEKTDGQDPIYWLHIHIANPTAFIKPESSIARYAGTVLQTLYLPEKLYPMMNPKMTQRHFSLAEDRPVLTFSAKITTDGEILGTKVTPGRIRKIKYITPDRVRRELGLGVGAQPFVSHTLTVGQHVGGEVTDGSNDTPLSTSEKSDLRLLHTLGAARRFKRSGVVEKELAFLNEIPPPKVFIHRDGIDPTYSPKHARRFIGDPTISWEAREASLDGEVMQDDERMFVTEAMLMAGEIAARWCGERNIPIPYRGTVRNPSLVTTPEAYQAQVLKPILDEIGYVPQTYRRVYNTLIGNTRLKSSPFPHRIIDTPAYTKATSPLRRFPDMLVHWQIQAALRHEAQHGQEALIGSTDDSYLPFSRTEMDALLATITAQEQSYKGALLWSNTHWIMQLLHRAFEYKQAPLPSVFDVQVTIERAMLKQATGESMGSVKQLSGFQTDLLENEVSSRHGGLRLGDRWQARIERVETYRGRLRMVPIRLTERLSEDLYTRYNLTTACRLYQPSGQEGL
ncbi:MAG: hypothetical protein Q9221_001587 [Calogaya cf. arnoldii]